MLTLVFRLLLSYTAVAVTGVMPRWILQTHAMLTGSNLLGQPLDLGRWFVSSRSVIQS